MSWVMAAVASAFFAGITSILAKCGLSETDSDVATALRTLVVLVFAWAMVAVVGSGHTIAQITPQSWLFLALSGLATGGSWICYFKALSLGDVNKVVPVDKSSTVMAVLLAIVLFGETSHLEVKLVGTAVIAVGRELRASKAVPGWCMPCWQRCSLPLLRCWQRWVSRALNRTWQPPFAPVLCW